MGDFRLDEDSVLGLIPARGGSKSIPLKNLAPLAGKPLIAYVAKAGLGARHLGSVVCSTDHEQIIAACRDLDIEVIERPEALGQDDTPVAHVIAQVLRSLMDRDGAAPGAVALLQPTSPFMLPRHIDACVEALRAHPSADSAQTVAPVFHNAHAFNQRVIADGYVRFRFLEERRQAYNKQRKPSHYLFGNVVVTRSRNLLAGGDCFGERSVPVEIPRAYALDVDTMEDLDYADYLVRHGKLALVR